MVINWYGENCFKISEGPLTIMTDPIESGTGLSVPRFKADIVIKTLLKTPSPEDTKPISQIDGETNVIAGPGEYEIKDIAVNGWPLLKESSSSFLKSIFKVKMGDMSLGILGHISEFKDPDIFAELGDIDILFIPGGNAPFIGQSDAARLIRQIEPRVVIPGFFKVKGLVRKANSVNDFLKELGQSTVKPAEKLAIKKKDLNMSKTEVVVLSV